MQHLKIEQLGSGVYAALATNEGSAGCNAGIVDLGGSTLVYDTCATLTAARELRAVAGKLTGRPPAWIVNSHEHPDHFNGNRIFEDGILVASHATREAIARQGRQRMGTMRRQIEARAEGCRRRLAAATDPAVRAELTAEVREYDAFSDGYPTGDDLRLPTLSFEGSLTLHGSARSAELIDCGPSHSPGDAVLWLPQERVLFTGDLVVSGNLILCLGTPERWPAVLDRLEALGADVLVQGHGGLVSPAEGFGSARRYLDEIFRLADGLAAAGEKPDCADRIEVPAEYHEYWFRENVRHLLGRRPASAT
ncbi:MAG TPA: MBL fold metallo-hydrolase [Symbiobacteriaceae bacterium]|nr:MBL fold metallo-hydrolase [Symbiobacteriaceae bacterium]